MQGICGDQALILLPVGPSPIMHPTVRQSAYREGDSVSLVTLVTLVQALDALEKRTFLVLERYFLFSPHRISGNAHNANGEHAIAWDGDQRQPCGPG